MRSDFETYGLCQAPVAVPNRLWWLTVDFEAFAPAAVPLWCRAMERWADRAREHGLRFAFFISVEQVAALRSEAPQRYEQFLKHALRLHQAGCEFHPHNHYVFDRESGRRVSEPSNGHDAARAYSKRRSMFYDAVYRCGLTFESWVVEVVGAYRSFLRDAGISCPPVLAFRAGGWDYGSSLEDLGAYVSGLRRAGVAVDSSACAGTFGTPSWQAGLPFGTNVFRIHPALLEVAPCWHINCGVDSAARMFAGQARGLLRSGACSLYRRGGVLTTVLHFDHLFHETLHGRSGSWGVTDFTRIGARIDRLFAHLSFWRSALGFGSFDLAETAGTPYDCLPGAVNRKS